MTFDDKLNELINEVEVPDELSPKNVARMLKAHEQSKMEAEHRNIKASSSIAAQRRTIIIRTVAATAACAVFAAGMIAYNESIRDVGDIEEQINYAAVSPDSYKDLYEIYTGITLDGTGDTDKDTGTPAQINKQEDTTSVITENAPEPPEALSELSAYEFTDLEDDRVSRADIVKSDGTNLYCITDGKLYIISLETMEIVAEADNKLNPPVELYIEGNKLILISKETEEMQILDTNNNTAVSEATSSDTPTASDVPAYDADSLNSNDIVNSDSTDSEADVTTAAKNKDGEKSVSRTNVVVDIYDISDKTTPTLTTTYKQNGSYTSSRIIDGILYTVTGYSEYRLKPLDAEADLDNYVPAYCINGEKKYVEAGNIIIPSNANSTDYTVLSAINCGSESVSVKAVLGSCRNVYCSADTLYVVCSGRKEPDNSTTDYSVITSFSLSAENGMMYKASSSVAGRTVSQYSMNEYDGQFRIATKITDEYGVASVSLYSLDNTLTVIKSAGQLLAGENVTSVRFEENFASLYTDSSEAAAVIDLTTTPPTQAESLAGSSAYLYDFGGDKLLGLGVLSDNTGLTLTMFASESGAVSNTVNFADDIGEISSKALTDRRAIFIDAEKSVIGVPVYSHNEFGTRNRYYVFSYDNETDFTQKGVIEYSDIDDSMIFERAVISGDTLYVIGNKRIISVQLADMKIIGTYEF